MPEKKLLQLWQEERYRSPFQNREEDEEEGLPRANCEIHMFTLAIEREHIVRKLIMRRHYKNMFLGILEYCSEAYPEIRLKRFEYLAYPGHT